MSNSALVDYTCISPNSNNPRNTTIKKITIHHMAGNLSVESCGAIFAASSRQASSNYGIGSDGRVGMYVEEANRSWCSSSAENDHQAVTIEVANSATTSDWPVSDAALAKLIDLCVDICERNGIAALNYTGDTSGNLTMHKWFSATACPGPYLEARFAYIAEEVNKRLGSGSSTDSGSSDTGGSTSSSDGLYRVQVGAYAQKANATATETALKAKGYDTYVVQADGLYKVQVGAYAVKSNAEAMAAKLTADGFDTYVTTSAGTSADSAAAAIAKGDKVKVKSGAKTYTGGGLASFVYSTVYDVIELNGDRAVIGIGSVVTAAINVADLIKQ